MRLVDRLSSSYEFLGDPLDREAEIVLRRLLGDMQKIMDAYYEHYDTKTMVDIAKQAVKEFGNGKDD